MLSLFDGIATGEVLEEGLCRSLKPIRKLGEKGMGRVRPHRWRQGGEQGVRMMPTGCAGCCMWALWSRRKALSPPSPGRVPGAEGPGHPSGEVHRL